MKTLLVAGSSSDIGKSIIFEGMERGWSTIGTHLSTLGQGHRVRPCDLSNDVSIDSFFTQLGCRTIDAVVMSSFPFLTADPMNIDQASQALKLLAGHIRFMSLATQRLVENGRIINILGQCVNSGLVEASHYSAAFAYMHNWAAAVNSHPEYGKKGKVWISDLLLALVNTRELDGMTEEDKSRYTASMVRIIEADDVANQVWSLIESPYPITSVMMDGGYNLR